MRRTARKSTSMVPGFRRVFSRTAPVCGLASAIKTPSKTPERKQYWTDLGGDLGAGRSLDFASIPIVDLASSKAVSTMRSAAMLQGFFYVSNHGVDPKLIAGVFEQARQFFALALEQKMTISCKDSPNRGFFYLGGENLGPKQTGDYKEGVDIGLDDDMRQHMGYRFPSVKPTASADAQMRLPNRWPSSALLPDYKRVMQTYFGAMCKLGMELTRSLALALELDKQHFDTIFRDPMASLRILHYPPQEHEVSDEHLGAGPHTDYGMLTILAQSSSGLQVRNRAGEWIAVPVIPDTFVINLGDAVPILTNGVFVSTPHRVINKFDKPQDRYSIPFFHEPDFDAVLEPIAKFVPASQQPKFKPISFGEHLKSLYESTYKKA